MTHKILIIDDEEKLRSLLARIIKSEGFEVIEAKDLKTGFKKLEQTDIDVVLCDVKLPDGNGVDFLQNIKGSFPLTEVILLTAFGNIADGVQAMKNGASRRRAVEELADVVICALGFANRTGINLAQAVANKVLNNSKKYPSRTYKGRF